MSTRPGRLPGPRAFRCRCRSATEPVRHLHEEYVARALAEELVEVAPERATAGHRRAVFPSLAPHEEQCRARTVLPAEDDVRAELLHVEPARIVGDRRIGIRLEPVLVLVRA